MTRASAAPLFLLVLAGTSACGSGEAPREPTAAAPHAIAESAEPEPELPPRGEVEVRFGANGIEAFANQAPRQRVLEALARETGLVVVAFVEGGDPNGPVTLQSQGEPIEVVLARALAGVPFSLEPREPGARERLTLVVGRAERSRRPAAGAAPPRPPRPAAADAERVERALRARGLEDRALEQLESRDARERVEGVEWADLNSLAGFEAVVDLLANDPDPTVRAAAAETLGTGEVGAVRPLLGALEDDDPRVVLAALDSLELLGDATIIPDLAPALEHPDPSVRERAEEVRDFVE
jgi:hypothetical protein